MFVSELNESLRAENGINFQFSVNNEGEYGYIVTDSEGADTFVPFKQSSCSSGTDIAVVTFTGANVAVTLDVSEILPNDYQNLTVDNFAFIPHNNGSYPQIIRLGVTSYVLPSMSYEEGILTIKNGYMNWYASGWYSINGFLASAIIKYLPNGSTKIGNLTYTALNSSKTIDISNIVKNYESINSNDFYVVINAMSKCTYCSGSSANHPYLTYHRPTLTYDKSGVVTVTNGYLNMILYNWSTQNIFPTSIDVFLIN